LKNFCQNLSVFLFCTQRIITCEDSFDRLEIQVRYGRIWLWLQPIVTKSVKLLNLYCFLICFGSLYCFNKWHSHITCNVAIVVLYYEHSKI